jgi:hypothetical protein
MPLLVACIFFPVTQALHISQAHRRRRFPIVDLNTRRGCTGDVRKRAANSRPTRLRPSSRGVNIARRLQSQIGERRADHPVGDARSDLGALQPLDLIHHRPPITVAYTT